MTAGGKLLESPRSKLEREFATRIREIGTDLPPYVEQYRFSHRRYTFDFAWPKYMISVEIDGGNRMVRWSKKTQHWVVVGKHTRSVDYEKLNYAGGLGWGVLRFTGEMLRSDPVKCIKRVREALRTKGADV